MEDVDLTWLKIKGSTQEARSRAEADRQQREAEGAASKSVILNARDVEGEYDAERVLTTTLNGVERVLTHDDLAAFRQNIRTVQKHFKSGLRARQVLDLSRKIDLERANTQIHMAVPLAASAEPAGSGALVRFMTNAGPDSKDQRHHVLVNFTAYAAAASGARGNAKDSANWLRRQPLKIECDCGRWRYWYRYVATIGQFNAGRDETGFPKIRNPDLHGVACKHLLRVMHVIESSPILLSFLERMIQTARDRDNNKVSIRSSQKTAEAQAKAQKEQETDVRDGTRRRERQREYSNARRAKLKAANAQSPAHQKDGAATRASKAVYRSSIQSEDEAVEMYRKLAARLNAELTAEVEQEIRAEYRSAHAQ